jgi:hypothetical protein
MIRHIAIILLLASQSIAAVTAGGDIAAVPKLSVGQIVEKNVAARGGLEAWRKVQTMVWLGHLQSGTAAIAAPFVMQMKRPDKMRFEITVDNQKSIRAFDGRQGWKVRPPRTGGATLAPFSDEEVRFAKDAPGMDGPLIDHEAKGIGVELEGSDTVEGREAYRLAVKLPSGATRHLWIDAKTFLEIKYDRESRGAGRTGTISVLYRDYRPISGLQIPMATETMGADGRVGDRMVIDRVLLNPPLDDSQFASPGGRSRHSAQPAQPAHPTTRSAVSDQNGAAAAH